MVVGRSACNPVIHRSCVLQRTFVVFCWFSAIFRLFFFVQFVGFLRTLTWMSLLPVLIDYRFSGRFPASSGVLMLSFPFEKEFDV
jgi:hypothetical protein